MNLEDEQERSAPEEVSAAARTMIGQEIDGLLLEEIETEESADTDAELVLAEEPTPADERAYFKLRSTPKSLELMIGGPQQAVVAMVAVVALVVIVALLLRS